LFLRRGRTARRKPGQALVVTEGARLPTIYLGETKAKRELPPVYLCEAGQEEAGHRLKWLASTCLAGMVGVCVIGLVVYASMNLSDGKGMVSSIKQASLAAMKPMRTATLANDGQAPTAVEKGDRIQLSASGFTSRDVIHETVVQHQGSREYITIKPYLRIVAGLATAQPDDAETLPPFNPFKLYTDATPVGSDGPAANNGANAPQAVSIYVAELSNGLLPQDDGVELKEDEIDELVAEAAENFAYADPASAGDVTGSLLQPAAYRTDNGLGLSPLAPNLTVIHKSVGDDDDDANDVADDLLDGSTLKVVKVGRGDTLASIVAKMSPDPDQAKDIVEALAPVFPAGNLKPGQQVRFNLVPAPSDTEEMEPVKVGIYGSGDKHIASVARNNRGDFVVTDQKGGLTAEGKEQQARATLYASFYHAAQSQRIPTDTILKLLRVHSYDVDFKQKVKPGDTFDVFFDVPDDGKDRDEIGEMLYTAMTVDGATHSFYRFRTPDGVVDYYDEQGNSAKKFLMRNPVKGGRYTSGFGYRRHPLLGVTRMHTGVDWAAPAGTPIVAGADGTIERVGRQGGYGNYVRIRHTNGFATAYGHMSRYADGLNPGMKVKQGQVIGYVGSTGYSTGPHLHYEILVNNKFVNPMTIQVPRGLQLTGRELAEFQKERNRIDTLRQLDPVTSRVAQATTNAR
jgi:murein DD-endopeptidase MepM/ murein hydrolase activator NlpD